MSFLVARLPVKWCAGRSKWWLIHYWERKCYFKNSSLSHPQELDPMRLHNFHPVSNFLLGGRLLKTWLGCSIKELWRKGNIWAQSPNDIDFMLIDSGGIAMWEERGGVFYSGLLDVSEHQLYRSWYFGVAIRNRSIVALLPLGSILVLIGEGGRYSALSPWFVGSILSPCLCNISV